MTLSRPPLLLSFSSPASASLSPQNDDPSRISCLYIDLALNLISSKRSLTDELVKPQNDDPSRISSLYTYLALS